MLVVGPLSDVVSIESLLVVSGALTIVAALIIVTTGRTVRDPAAAASS
jgi:hypothetical protein